MVSQSYDRASLLSLFQRVTVTHIVRHAGYGIPSFLNNDFMILYFDPPVVFNQYVSPVCLPDQGQEFPAGIDAYAIGWGNIQGKHNI